MRWLVEWVLRRAQLTPYFHLYHRDGSAYMRRWWLMPRWLLENTQDDESLAPVLKPKRWVPFSLRVHEICTSDLDRDLHNHPWPFISLVLRGFYVEERPPYAHPIWITERRTFAAYEMTHPNTRRPGSIALRRASDRHRISQVAPGTFTLVLQFRKSQPWGFFTVCGFVHHSKYESKHV